MVSRDLNDANVLIDVLRNRMGQDELDVPTRVSDCSERLANRCLDRQPAECFQPADDVAGLRGGRLAHRRHPALIRLYRPYPSPKDFGKSQLMNWLAAAVGTGIFILALLPFVLQQPENSGISMVAAPPSHSADGVPFQEKTKNNPEGFVRPLVGLKAGQKELWRSALGTVAMRAPVVHGDRVFIGTNNEHGYLSRFPSSFDLGVLLCFGKSDGRFLWQHSNLKLPSGRIHDWPLMGITSRPCVSGERLFYVTNRGEIVCLDTNGFHDGEDDGVLQDEVHCDLKEADVVWRLDMMKELGVRPHNISTCTIAFWKGRLFVVTGHGVAATHLPPLADAPSFLAVESRTGKLLWQDSSPGQNVLHGQWGAPTVVEVQGKPQVIFPGGDGWLYSFDPEKASDGKGKLIWKFDCNPKKSVWKLAGRGTRNNLLHGPTLHDGRLYIAMGRDPEHGGGQGRLWCIDPNGTGDISPQLVYNKKDPGAPIGHRREQACVVEEGDFTLPNPNSKAIWLFEQQDVDGDGQFGIEEQMSRSLSTIAIQGELLFVSDIEGILHCIDRKTGKQHWGYDTLSTVYSTPVIVGEHVYLGTEDGEILVFGCSADLEIAAPDGEPRQRIECDASVSASVVSKNGVLYVVTKNELIAIENQTPAD